MKGPLQLFQDRFWTDGLKVAEGFVRICTHWISLVVLVYAGICVYDISYIYIYIYIYISYDIHIYIYIYIYIFVYILYSIYRILNST